MTVELKLVARETSFNRFLTRSLPLPTGKMRQRDNDENSVIKNHFHYTDFSV